MKLRTVASVCALGIGANGVLCHETGADRATPTAPGFDVSAGPA
jgi:hypothetical protein